MAKVTLGEQPIHEPIFFCLTLHLALYDGRHKDTLTQVSLLLSPHLCPTLHHTHSLATDFPTPLSLTQLTADINSGTMKKAATTENLFSHSNGNFTAARATDEAPLKMIHMLAIWQTAQPHSMPGSFSPILISCSKIKETIRKNMFADWQRSSKTSGHLSKSLISAITLSRKS